MGGSGEKRKKRRKKKGRERKGGNNFFTFSNMAAFPLAPVGWPEAAAAFFSNILLSIFPGVAIFFFLLADGQSQQGMNYEGYLLE